MTLILQTVMNQIEDFSLSYIESTDETDDLEKILIVDDEEIVRRFHTDCLSSRYKCFEAASAEKALEILEDEDISLVITQSVITSEISSSSKISSAFSADAASKHLYREERQSV